LFSLKLARASARADDSPHAQVLRAGAAETALEATRAALQEPPHLHVWLVFHDPEMGKRP